MVDFEKYGKQRVDWLDITGGTAVTVLDYFAGKAMGGFVTYDSFSNMEDTSSEWLKKIAAASYELAEAMLAERNKRFTPQGTVTGVTGKTYG